MTMIDKLAWIHIQDKKVLLARSHNKTAYYIPGGKRETGETDEEALSREINEELSIHLILSTIQYVATFTAQAHDKPAGQQVKLTCYSADYSGDIKAAAEIAEVRYISKSDQVELSPVTQLIMDNLAAQGLL